MYYMPEERLNIGCEKTKEKSNNKSFIDWMFVACLNYQFFVLKRYRQILKVSFNVRKLQIKIAHILTIMVHFR